MKHYFPIYQNKKLKSITDKIKFIKRTNQTNPLLKTNHSKLIAENNLQTKKYFEQYSKLMNI